MSEFKERIAKRNREDIERRNEALRKSSATEEERRKISESHGVAAGAIFSRVIEGVMQELVSAHNQDARLSDEKFGASGPNLTEWNGSLLVASIELDPASGKAGIIYVRIRGAKNYPQSLSVEASYAPSDRRGPAEETATWHDRSGDAELRTWLEIAMERLHASHLGRRATIR